MINFNTWFSKLLRQLKPKPIIAYLVREESSDHGTLGSLRVGSHEFCSLELPDRNNKPNLSCIPAGVYMATWHYSPHFGWVYKLTGVPGRSNILLHKGNWAGDVNKGYRTDSEGCILLGNKKTYDHKQQLMITGSGETFKEFYKYMDKRTFKLIVK